MIFLKLKKIYTDLKHGRAFSIMPKSHYFIMFKLIFYSLQETDNISFILLY